MQQRHNLRLADFAYAGAYVYFVTFCTQNRLPLLGSVQVLSVGADLRVRPAETSVVLIDFRRIRIV